MPKRQRVEPSRLPAGTLTTVMGLVVCVVLFCATSFAWITRDVGISSQLDIAEYDMTIVAPGDAVVTDYTCVLATNDAHTFTLTATGDATTGYCLVYVDDVLTHVTGQVGPNDTNPTITLTVTAGVGKTVRFQPLWGTHPNNTVSVFSLKALLGLENKESFFHSNTPHLVYEIPFGAKLEAIAAYYFPDDAEKGAENICIYNGIEKLPEVGETIRIPFVTAHPDGKPYAPVLYPLGGYTVVEGDTLESVAAALGVTPEMLTAAGIKAEALVPGAVISVKASDDADSMEYYATGVTISIKLPDSDKQNHYYTSGGVQDGKPTLAPGSDSDKQNHYYSSGGVQDGDATLAPGSDADDMDHYYTGSGVQDGDATLAPGSDADDMDHYYTGSGVQDGEVTSAPDGDDDADDSDYYPDSSVTDGEVITPPPSDGDGADDADKPDEGDTTDPAGDADDSDYYPDSSVTDGEVITPPPGDGDGADDADKPDEGDTTDPAGDADDGDYYSSGDVEEGTVTPAA